MKKKILTFWLLLVVILSYGQESSGGSCTDALIINHTESSCHQFQITNNQIWLKFTATSSYINVLVENNYSLNKLIIYSGICSNLNIIDSTSLISIQTHKLVVGNDYYLVIEGANEELIMFIQNSRSPLIPNCEDPIVAFTDCNKIFNGNFTEGTFTLNNSVSIDTDCFLADNEEVPGWVSHSGVALVAGEPSDIGNVARFNVTGGS